MLGYQIPASVLDLVWLPFMLKQWNLDTGGRKITLLENANDGFKPGTYILDIRVQSRLDSRSLELFVSGVSRKFLPFLIDRVSKWAYEHVTDGWTRYLLKVPAKVPKLKYKSKETAIRMIEKRRLKPVIKEEKTSNYRLNNIVKTQIPMQGQWLWKGQEVTITYWSYTPGQSVVPPNPAMGHRFTSPTIDGFPLDWCYKFASGCGKNAADAFCVSHGYMRSVSHDGPDMAPRKTKIIGSNNKFCNAGYCGTFFYI